MKGLILAAGYGTRLYPLTLERPKPLLEVGGKSILERLLRKLEDVLSCDEVYIVTNDKFYQVIEDWRADKNFRFPIEVINDGTMTNDDRLGAIGDISLVLGKKRPQDDVLIMAGDNLFEFDISSFIYFAERKKCLTVALYDIKDPVLARQYGIVSLDKKSKVVDFQEKPELPKGTLASTGIYFLPQDKIQAFSEYMQSGESKDAPGNFVKWMSENNSVYGYVFTEGWYDIGDKKSLDQADLEYKKKGI